MSLWVSDSKESRPLIQLTKYRVAEEEVSNDVEEVFTGFLILSPPQRTGDVYNKRSSIETVDPNNDGRK